MTKTELKKRTDAFNEKYNLSVTEEKYETIVEKESKTVIYDFNNGWDSCLNSNPKQEKFAKFGEMTWNCVVGDDDEDEVDIMPFAELAGLCEKVEYDPEKHADLEEGDQIWRWEE